MAIEHPERLQRVFIPGVVGGQSTIEHTHSTESPFYDDDLIVHPHSRQQPAEVPLEYNYWRNIVSDDPVARRNADDVATWDEVFMGTATIWAKRSKDPNTQVGAVIVKSNRIVSTGYNGSVHGLDESKENWRRDATSERLTKYASVIHAEQNAIYNILGLGIAIEDSTIYTTLFPCNECAKAIIQCGIREVVFMGMDHNNGIISDNTAAAIDRFVDSGIKLRQFIPERHLQNNMIII